MFFKKIDYWIKAAMQFKLRLYWKWQMQVNEAIFLNLRYSVFGSSISLVDASKRGK